MADLVNLRQARKAKARSAKEQQAEQNRAKFGRTKAEKGRDATDAKRVTQALDGAHLKDRKDQ